MRDANLEALDKYLSVQQVDEEVQEEFLEKIQPYIDGIDALLSDIKEIGDNYANYDFDELIRERVKDLL